MSFQTPEPLQIPVPTEPFTLPDGSINPVWYRYLLSQDRAMRAMLKFLRAQFP
jgi:hypothetical protein